MVHPVAGSLATTTSPARCPLLGARSSTEAPWSECELTFHCLRRCIWHSIIQLTNRHLWHPSSSCRHILSYVFGCGFTDCSTFTFRLLWAGFATPLCFYVLHGRYAQQKGLGSEHGQCNPRPTCFSRANDMVLLLLFDRLASWAPGSAASAVTMNTGDVERTPACHSMHAQLLLTWLFCSYVLGTSCTVLPDALVPGAYPS
jgi:hypothetical protein